MAQSGQPLVSILIRSMDRPTLQRALDSAAAQTWANLEIVVVAACGREHRALPSEYRGRRLRLILPEGDRRLPRAEAANVALEAAAGEWFNFLDDDDELLPQHLTTLLTAPRSEGERVIFSRTRVVDATGKALGHVSHAGNHVQLYFHSRATTCATLLHRSLVDDGVRFDPAFAVHEDHDFQVNCATRTPFRFVDAATCIWHADAGESGCGFGANDDPSLRDASVQMIRRKWAPAFESWLADPQAMLQAGRAYLDGGDLEAASACLEQALHLRPADINAQNLGGVAHLRAGNLDRAEFLLTQALAQLPGHAGIRANLDLLRRARQQRATQQQ
ncbi:MAG: glycosyltransferase [Gammaproteobacteria bacterium]|nr:MAG: glycosyltransferase [Gammaproteobacteria bacterium]